MFDLNASASRSAINRRHWLVSGATSALGLAGWISGPRRVFDEIEAAALDRLAMRLKAAGLEPEQVVERDLYVGTGDAPLPFQERALELCAALAADFLDHFARRGMPVEKPLRRLLVVILAGPRALAAFLKIEPDPELRGIYDLNGDWLAICDNRGGGGPLAERANSIALYHEAMHQLCFHCGLLEREADVPLLISEGLATYGEVRRPDGRTKIGTVNAERLAVLGKIARGGGSLIPLADLVVNDALFDQPDTRQAAYAQAWLLIHWLMQPPNRPAKFRAYLDAIRLRREASKRLADWTEHLGEPEAMAGELKRHVNVLLRRFA